MAVERRRNDGVCGVRGERGAAKRAGGDGGGEDARAVRARGAPLDGGGGLEYATIAINFDEEYAVLERKACVFELDERGRTRVRAMEAASLRVDLGWTPRFGAVRGRALELAARAMPTVPSCAMSSQFIVVVWLDGERPVRVIDSRAEGSTDSRRGLLEALRVNVEACVANPDAKTSRTVLDVTTYDGGCVRDFSHARRADAAEIRTDAARGGYTLQSLRDSHRFSRRQAVRNDDGDETVD